MAERKPYDTFKGAFDRLVVTDTKVHEVFRSMLSNKGAVDPNTDARITGIAKIGAVTENACLILVMAQQTIDYVEWWNRFTIKSVPERQLLTNNFEGTVRRSLIFDTFVAVETTIRAISKEISPAWYKDGMPFKNVYDYLLIKQLSKPYTDEVPLLDLMRNIRNTIHNNTVYMSKNSTNETVTWKGVAYNFIHRKTVKADWPFVCDRIDDLLEMMQTLLKDPVVLALTRVEDVGLAQTPQAVIH